MMYDANIISSLEFGVSRDIFAIMNFNFMYIRKLIWHLVVLLLRIGNIKKLISLFLCGLNHLKLWYCTVAERRGSQSNRCHPSLSANGKLSNYCSLNIFKKDELLFYFLNYVIFQSGLAFPRTESSSNDIDSYFFHVVLPQIHGKVDPIPVQ